MRAKQLWNYVPLPAKAKLLWDRLTVSRITTIYFVFSLLHCILQLVFQTQAFTINARAADFLHSIVRGGDAQVPGFFQVVGDSLRYCDHVPHKISAASCQVVWNGTSVQSTNAQGAVQNGNSSSNSYGSSSSSASALSSSVSATPSIATTLNTTSSFKTLDTFPSGGSSSTPVRSATSASASSTPVVRVASSATSSTPAARVTVTKVVVQIPTATTTSSDDDDDLDHRRRYLSSETLQKRGMPGNSILVIDVDGQKKVALNGYGFNTETVLDQKCVVALNWPVQLLHNTKREDITFIAFQFWVLGMSIVALLNESIPHIIASLVTHMSATAWAGFQIWSTSAFHDDFRRIATNGACQINLLPTYWKDRANAEIPSLVLNTVALLVSAFLSWRLIKLFGWQTFKRIGASLNINRIYKLILTLSIAIQLSLFFVVASIGIWLDQICNGTFAHLSTEGTLYMALSIVVIVLLAPWLVTGWFAVRRELKIPMAVFLVLSGVLVIGWGAMFDSLTFRWTFVQWRFFSVIIVLSITLTLLTFILGVVCWFNFGHGLTHYLNAQEPLPGDDFVPVVPGQLDQDPEKVDFPSNDRPVPTFSAAFGSGAEVPPPSQMRFAPRQMGPRFFNSQAQPFESPVQTSPVQSPPVAHFSSLPSSVAPSAYSGSPTSRRPLVRHGSSGSEHSISSVTTVEPSAGGDGLARMMSNASRGNESISGRSRWVIE